MLRITPKYFHYFLSCLTFDSVLLVVCLRFFFDSNQISILLLIWIVANFINYPRRASRRYISYYRLLLLSFRQLGVFFAIIGLIYAIKYVGFDLIKLNEVLAIFIVIVSRIMFVFFLRFYRNSGFGYNRFYMIGKTRGMNDLKEQFLSNKNYGYIFEGMAENCCNFEELKSIILDRKLNEIYCSSSAVDQKDLATLLSFSFEYGVDVHVITDNQKHEGTIENGLFLKYSQLSAKNYALIDQKNLMFKRIFDFSFSFLVVVFLLSWVIPILGIIIMLDSKGKALYVQPRAGRNGKYFLCLKFRSMKMNASAEQTTKNDPRVTRVGRMIRKLNIDELPQFINVLFGQMSVVGPRPHIKNLNDKFDSQIDDYNERLLVKPGITGLSQITGHRGETKDNQAMQDRVRMDLLYLENWSLWFDLLIIYKTIENGILGHDKNAY